jgi:hypothetical protein
VQSRVRVERQISELSATLLPGHPRMRQLTADLKGLKGQIAAEVGKIVDGLDKEAKVAALREEAIQASLADIKSRIVNAGPEEARLRSLEADARSKRAELDRLRAQFEANRARADDSRTIPVEAQIVSSARPSAVPVFPRKGATALLVAVATMMIGLALVITRGLLGGARVAGGMARPRLARRRERLHPVLPVPPRRGFTPERPLIGARLGEPSIDPGEGLAAPSDPFAPAMGAAGLSAEIETSPSTREIASVTEAPAASEPAADDPTTAEEMAARILALRTGGPSGTRTLLTGSDDLFVLAREAADVCRVIAGKGHTVIMVDWSLSGEGIASRMGQPTWPGFNDLVDGRARFEDVVRALDESDVHLIPCGRGLDGADEPPDSDNINFLLDALDDVYEHILVVARPEPAERLFEAIQGRFDCGVTLVSGDEQKARVHADGTGVFLGFEVEGIALFAFDHSDRPRERRKLARVG